MSSAPTAASLTDGGPRAMSLRCTEDTRIWCFMVFSKDLHGCRVIRASTGLTKRAGGAL